MSLDFSSLKFKAAQKGQQVVLPNLYTLFPDWTPKIHPEYQKARDEVLNPWIRRSVVDDLICKKLQKAEFGLFAAIMCADSSFEKMCTVAKYFAWYFVWDDIFDCGSLTSDVEMIKTYRDKSLEYFNYVLCDIGQYPDLSELSVELQKALTCWDEVGAHIRRECSQETCQVLLDTMITYVESVDDVNSISDGNTIPSLTAYWDRRERTAAVYPVIATIPFIYGFEISRNDLNEDMKSMWMHTSYIVHITNDMFSMRKELSDGQIENLIPVLMLNNGLLANEAMHLSYLIAQREAKSFEIAKTFVQASSYDMPRQAVDDLIVGCLNVAMGLVHWSYCGERYMKRAEIDGDHIVRFKL